MDRKPTYNQLELRVKELEKELRDAKRAGERLQETENIRELLKLAPFGVFLIDLSGKIVACNENGAKRLGKTTETAIGTVLRDYFPAKVSENRRLKGMEAIQSRQDITFEDQVKGRWYRNSIFPFFDKEGKPLRLAIYGDDVTEYKNALDELEKSEEKYRQLAELLPQVVFEIDEKGNLTFTNHVAFDLFGYSRADFENGLNALQMLIPEDRESAVANLQRALRGEQLGGIEYTALTKNGRRYPVMLYSSPIMKEGKPVGLRGIMIDRTERKQAEDALRESERFLQNIFDGIQDGISVLDRDLTIIRCNFRVEDWYAEHMPLVGKKCYKVYQGLQAPCPWCPSIRALKTGEVHSEIVPYPSAEKPRGWIELSSFPLKNDHGSVVGIIEHVKDITVKKQAEEALVEKEEKFRSLVDQAAEMLFLHDMKGNLIDVNIAAVENTGYSREEFEKMSVFDIDPDARDRNDMQIYWDSIKPEDPPVTFEVRHKRKDGSVYPAEVIASKIVLQDGPYILGLARDITERKQAEKALRESQAKLLQAQYIAGVGDFTWDIVTGALSWSDGMYELLKYHKDEIIDYETVNADIHHPDDLERVTKWLRDGIASGEEFLKPNEYRLIRKDGQVIHVRTNGRIEYENGQAVRLFGACLDITDQRKAEDQLRKSEEKFRLIAETSAEDIWQLDLTGQVTYASPAVQKLFGYTPDEAVSLGFSAFFPESEIERGTEAFSRALSGHRNQLLEFTGRRKDGSLVPIEVSVNPIIQNGMIIGVQGIARDITERKLAEEALRESEDRYRDLVEESLDGIFIQKGPKIIFANKRLNEMLGYGEGELIGQRHWVIYHPDYQKLTRERAQARMREEEVVHRYEVKLQRKDGSWFYGEVNARPSHFLLTKRVAYRSGSKTSWTRNLPKSLCGTVRKNIAF